MFRYRVEGGYGVFDLGEEELASMKVNPGLSAYAEDPDGAGESLVELLEYAKTRVPRDQWGVTEIRLMATAGLRVLELDVQNRILESCRWVLRSSGFKFRDEWALVITGFNFSSQPLHCFFYCWCVISKAFVLASEFVYNAYLLTLCK